MSLSSAFFAAPPNRHAVPRRLLAALVVLLPLFLLAAPAPAHALRAVLMADTQGTDSREDKGLNRQETAAVIRAILNMSPKPDLVFCVGDMVESAFSEENGFQFEAWKAFMRPLTQAGIPLHVLKGNHELASARKPGETSPLLYFVRNQREYAKAFASMLPANGPEGYEGLAYTVSDAATATVFVAVDSFFLDKDLGSEPYRSFGHISQAQLDWLRGPLPAVDSAVHRILLAHTPAFNPKRESLEFIGPSFQRLWEVLEEKRFDLMIAAHVHVFSYAPVDARTYPASRHPLAQVVIGPVGGFLSTKESIRADPALWPAITDRNFLLLEIDGPKPGDAIRLTPYVRNAEGEYLPGASIVHGKRAAGG